MERLRQIRPENVYLALAIPFTLVILLILPPVGGFDEHTHAARIEQLSTFNLFSDFVGYANPGDQSAEQMLYGGQINAGYWTFINDAFERTHYSEENLELGEPYRLYTQTVDVPETMTAVFSNTAVNTPLVYFPYIIGSIVSKLLTNSAYLIYMSQIVFGLIFCIASSYYAIHTIPYGKWVLLAYLLNHNIVTCSMFLTADTVTLCTIICYVAQVLHIMRVVQHEAPSKYDWIALFAFSLILSGVKATYIPLAFLSLLILIVSKKNGRPALVGTALALCLTIFTVWFVFVIKPINTGAMWPVETHPAEQSAYLLSHPFEFVANVVRQLNLGDFLQVHGDSSLVIYRAEFVGGYPLDKGLLCWLIVIASLAVFEKDELETFLDNKTLYLVCATMVFFALACLFLVYAALYVSFTPVGSNVVEGVQPRYFQPLAPLLLIGVYSLLCAVVRTVLAHSQRQEQKNSITTIVEKYATPANAAVKIVLVIAVIVQLILLTSFVYNIFYNF